MNVLVCIPCLLTGGTEIQTLNLVKSLVLNGHNVITVCYFEYAESIVNQYLSAGSKVICFSKRGCRINGIKGILFLFRHFQSVLKLYSIDIAHVQYITPGAVPIILLRILGVRNIITTIHTTADIYSNLKLVHFIQKYCVRVFTCITCRAEESFFGKSVLYDESLSLKKRNHFTIYNSLPSYIPIASHEKNFLRSTEITIGVVSRLDKIKGMDLVVPSFQKTYSQFNNVRLLVVGDGPLRKQMEDQTKYYNLTQVCDFVGRINGEELIPFYDKIDILLMPSRSEGFGLTAIEGMARGSVVIASNVGGLPEIITDGKTGLLHKLEDINDISLKILYLIKNIEILQQMSVNALKEVNKFNFTNYCNLFHSLYSKLECDN